MKQYTLTVLYRKHNNAIRQTEWKELNLHFVGLYGLHCAMDYAHKFLKEDLKARGFGTTIFGVSVYPATVWGQGYARY